VSDEDQNESGDSSESDGEPTVAQPAAAETTSPEPTEPAVPGTASTSPPSADVPTDGTATNSPPARPGVVIPRWVAIVIGVLVVVLGSGAIGYAIGHDSGSDDHNGVEMRVGNRGGPFGQYGPQGPNRPSGPLGPFNPYNGDQVPGANPVSGAFLGVSVEAVSGGVRITAVASGTPAEDAGLKAGDVITALDDKPVTTPAALVAQVRAHNPGDQVTIAYLRDGNAATAKVTLGTRGTSGTKS
jgi:membrane-associated protease RseP (regulator of RpoE activity)